VSSADRIMPSARASSAIGGFFKTVPSGVITSGNSASAGPYLRTSSHASGSTSGSMT
jgi:hypothetical protein